MAWSAVFTPVVGIDWAGQLERFFTGLPGFNDRLKRKVRFSFLFRVGSSLNFGVVAGTTVACGRGL